MSLQSLYEGMEKRASDEDAFMEGFLDKLGKEAATSVTEAIRDYTEDYRKETTEAILRSQKRHAPKVQAAQRKHPVETVARPAVGMAGLVGATGGAAGLLATGRLSTVLKGLGVGAAVGGVAGSLVGAYMLSKAKKPKSEKTAAEKKKRPGRFAPAVGNSDQR